MADAAQLRALAAARLMEGGVAEALRHARDYLQAVGAPAPVMAYPLLHPTAAIAAKGVEELRIFDSAPVASTAHLIEGVQQHVHWAAPYTPPVLRVLAMERATGLAPNIIVTQGGQLLDDNVSFSNAELCEHMPAGFPGIVAGGGQILMAVRHRTSARVNEAAIYLPALRNYAEWVFGCLPRLAAFADAPDMPILLHGDVAPFHRDSLRAMGVDDKRLRVHGANVRLECKRLHYCTPTYFHHAPSAMGVAHVRERVGVRVTPGPARRLYLARRHATDRPLINEAEVIALFERHGFTAVDPEQHSFDTQVRDAAGASIVAGPYGGNLANLVFARDARKCLILSTKQQPEFARLTSALGIGMRHVIPQAVQLRQGRTFSESFGFQADLQQIEHALQILLADEPATA